MAVRSPEKAADLAAKGVEVRAADYDRPETLTTALAGIAGRDVAYRDLTPEEHRQALVGAGLPDALAEMLVDIDRRIAEGALADAPGDLQRLIGRPTTPLADTLAEALRS